MSALNKLVDLVGNNMPSIPSVVSELQEIMDNDFFSTTDVEELISRDPALTIRILKTANSPAYGLSRQIDSVSQALMLLGTAEIRDIVFGTSFVKSLNQLKVDQIDMPAFWKHSIACGLCSRYLASKVDANKAEGFFIAGLLHDIGRLMMAKIFPDQYKQAIELSHSEKISIIEAERKIFKLDHATLADAILKQWRMPMKLRNIVTWHHLPAQSKDFEKDVTIVHLADATVEALEIGTSGEPLIDLQSNATMQKYVNSNVLAESIEEIETLVEVASGSLLDATA
ncbi:MAG: HDOD domain-containing protein [Verrucomicrobiota bacterium]